MTKTKAPGALVIALALTLLVALAAPSLSSAQAGDLLGQAAEAYAQRADLAKAKQAAELYRQALQAEPGNEEAAWRLAQTLYWVGTHLPEDQQLATLEQAVEAAKKAVAVNPKSLAGHFWLGVTYGVYGKAKGIMKSLSLVEPIKEEMALVIKADPAYEEGGPYRVLGRLYFKLPGLVGGSNDKAVENLKLAIQHGPQRWLNHLYLAEVYKAMGKKDQARALLNTIIAGPAESGLEPEFADWKAEAEKMLKEL